MLDPYLNKDSQVLRNKLGLASGSSLKDAEADYVSLRLRQIILDPLAGSFDFDHLCKYHRFIFQDIFDWAGQPRVMDIEKPELALSGMSVEYAPYRDIPTLSIVALKKLHSTTWQTLSDTQKAVQLSKNMAELWKIHPFREGNTRTIITFFCEFSRQQGFPLNSQLFEKNAAYMRSALVASSAVFSDIGDLSKPEYLQQIMEDAIK